MGQKVMESEGHEVTFGDDLALVLKPAQAHASV